MACSLHSEMADSAFSNGGWQPHGAGEGNFAGRCHQSGISKFVPALRIRCWMERNHPDKPFARYADDGVAHCRSREDADNLYDSLQQGFTECGLKLQLAKTRIVYCNDDDVPVIVATSIDRTNIGTLSKTYDIMKELAIQVWRVAPPQEIGNYRQTVTNLTWREILSACAPVTARWSEDSKPFQLQMPVYRSREYQNRYSPESYD